MAAIRRLRMERWTHIETGGNRIILHTHTPKHIPLGVHYGFTMYLSILDMILARGNWLLHRLFASTAVCEVTALVPIFPYYLYKYRCIALSK